MYLYMLVRGVPTSYLLDGYLVSNVYTIALKLLVLISGYFVLDASESYMRRHTMHLLEYPIMLLIALLFMLLLVGANHVIAAFFSIAGFSLCLYVLVFSDAALKVAREAGIKYFFLSTLTNGLLVYGMFLIYATTGTGNLDELALILQPSDFTKSIGLLGVGVTFTLTGLLFKLSAFPGHLWAPDVYEGSPTPVIAFFMLPVKISVFAFFLRLLSTAFAHIDML
jgi:NADH-quinone oxidoreductase subunit N